MGLSRYSPAENAQRGADLKLVDPADRVSPILEDGRPVTVHVLGRDAPVVQEVLQDLMRRQRDGEDIDSEHIGKELMIACIDGWSDNLCLEEPGDLPYSPENARRLLTDHRLSWILEQIGPFSLSRKNFVQNRSTEN